MGAAASAAAPQAPPPPAIDTSCEISTLTDKSFQSVESPSGIYPSRNYLNKILVLDDESHAGLVLSTNLLRDLNIAKNVIAVTSVQEASQLIEDSFGDNDLIDVLFVNFETATSQDPSLVSKLRGRGYRGIIVGITALDEGENHECFLKSGANAVLPKPLRGDAVIMLLSRLMGVRLSTEATLPHNIFPALQASLVKNNLHDMSRHIFGKILVLDDESHAGLILSTDLLRDLNIAKNVIAVTSVQEASQLIEDSFGDNDLIDVLFVNFETATSQDPSLVSKLRGCGYRGIIVGITTLDKGENHECFLKSGANAVLPKPLRGDAVLRTLSCLINQD